MPIVDAHTHLFSPAVQADRGRYAAADPFFGHLYSSPRAALVSVAEMLADMDAAGVDRAVVVGWPWQLGDLCREQNDWLMAVAQQHAGRLIVLGTVQPLAGPEAIAELRRCVEGGLAGVGELNADGQQFALDDPAVLALAHAAVELDAPLLLHTNEPVGHVYPGKGRLALAELYTFIRAVPELRLVLAHWGGGFPFYELMPEVRAAAANVCYDSAASPLIYSPEVFRAVIGLVGASKVLFGSDYPLLLAPKRDRLPSFSPLLETVKGLGLPEDVLADVLGRNALRVYLKQPAQEPA